VRERERVRVLAHKRERERERESKDMDSPLSLHMIDLVDMRNRTFHSFDHSSRQVRIHVLDIAAASWAAFIIIEGKVIPLSSSLHNHPATLLPHA
jgi:hypothetical protein